MTKRPLSPCRLCGETRTLCRSHIVPQFVADWLKKTSATGRLRWSDVPNRRVEDLEWRYWLCEECEGRLQKHETVACEKIFMPLHDRGQTRFRYGGSFAHFAASVAWRALERLRDDGHATTFADCPGALDAALDAWKSFNLGRSSTIAPYELHAVPMDVPTNLDADVAPYFSRFVLRTVAIKPYLFGGAGYIIVKLVRLVIVGTVVPSIQRSEWRNTRIHVNGGAWGDAEYRVPGWFGIYFKVAARKLQELSEGLSDRQVRKTADALSGATRSDPDRVLQSESFKAFMKDLEIFGDDAFFKGDSDGS